MIAGSRMIHHNERLVADSGDESEQRIDRPDEQPRGLVDGGCLDVFFAHHVGLSMPCCLALSTIICPLRSFWRRGSEAVPERRAQCTGSGSLNFWSLSYQ